MFSPEFFPTPAEVAALMAGPEELSGKIVYDPQGGSGALVDYARESGAKESISNN